MSTTTTAPTAAVNASPSRIGYDPNFKMPPRVEPSERERVERRSENWGKSCARTVEAEWHLYIPVSWDRESNVATIKRGENGLPYRVNMNKLTCNCFAAGAVHVLNEDRVKVGLEPCMLDKHPAIVDMNLMNDPKWLENVENARVITTE